MNFRLIWVIVLLLLTACGETGTMAGQAKSFEAELSEVKDASAVETLCTSVQSELLLSISEAVTIGRKYPAFMVQGSVTDTSEGALQIFGRAFVDPTKGLSHWASNGNERNVIVINPKNSIHNPSYYVGQHYFIKKDSGKNGFGAEVPVWVFGDPPEELAIAIQKRMLHELKLGMCNERLKALTKPAISIAPPPVQRTASSGGAPSSARVWTPSFDCANATSYVEREICANQLLSQLDSVLSENVTHFLAADVGDGARSELRQGQHNWLRERDKCTTAQCLINAYRARVDEVCEIPVLSGMHPVCTTTDEIK